MGVSVHCRATDADLINRPYCFSVAVIEYPDKKQARGLHCRGAAQDSTVMVGEAQRRSKSPFWQAGNLIITFHLHTGSRGVGWGGGREGERERRKRKQEVRLGK